MSLLAIGVSVNSLLPIVRGISSNMAMFVMGAIVLALSLVEFIALMKVHSKNESVPDLIGHTRLESEIRTYEISGY